MNLPVNDRPENLAIARFRLSSEPEFRAGRDSFRCIVKIDFWA